MIVDDIIELIESYQYIELIEHDFNIPANSHALSVRLTHFYIVSRLFFNITFLTQFGSKRTFLTHQAISEKYSPIFRKLSDFSKKVSPIFPVSGKIFSPIFRFRKKCLPDFPISEKNIFPIFPNLEKSFPEFPISEKMFPRFSDSD